MQYATQKQYINVRVAEELPTLRVDGALLAECRSRVLLAARIGLEQHRLARTRRSTAWLRQQTQDADIELDSGSNRLFYYCTCTRSPYIRSTLLYTSNMVAIELYCMSTSMFL